MSLEDREDRCSGVPEYLRTKTAGLGLCQGCIGEDIRVKGDSENVGEMEDMPTEMYVPVSTAVHTWHTIHSLKWSFNSDKPGARFWAFGPKGGVQGSLKILNTYVCPCICGN